MTKEYMTQWLKDHEARKVDFRWAVQYCSSLEEAWNTAKPDWLIWVATRKGVLTGRKLHDFALYCADSVRHLITDKRSLNALDMKRRWLDGEATDEELASAVSDAWVAESYAWDIAWLAAEDSATREAKSDTWAATRSAACAASQDVVAKGVSQTVTEDEVLRPSGWSAAQVAAESAAWALRSAEEATRAAQAKWLRDNCKPTFRG